MHFSKILVTTDFSEPSYAAFDIAAYDHKMSGTEVRLICVYQYFHPGVALTDQPTPLIGAEQFEEERKQLQLKLEALAQKYFHGESVTAEVVLSLNSPADTICFYAEEHQSQAIIIGSRGRTPLSGLFLGSTVQGVLQRSSCPVVVVPASKR